MSPSTFFINFDFFPEVIIRTPFFSVNFLGEKPLDEILNDPAFLEALYIATPDLVHLLNERNFVTDEDINNTVYKYFIRMCCRCTPFGLFAGSGIVKWGDESSLVVAHDAITKRNRLDRELLDRIIENMLNCNEIFKQLRFFPNNTIYDFGRELRYVEKIASENNRTEFNISAVNNSAMLSDFLEFISPLGRNCSEIVDYLTKRGYSKKRSQKFIRNMHENQLLQTNLSLALPANELLEHCAMLLQVMSVSNRSKKIIYWKEVLTCLKKLLAQADNCNTYDYRKYNELLAEINKLPLELPIRRFIQVDYTYKKCIGFVNKKVQNKLALGIQVLSTINTSNLYNDQLESFKKRFVKKYESQEVSLLKALDPESGIDYTEGASSFDEFLYEEFGVGSTIQKVDPPHLNFNQKYIISKFEDAASRNEQVIDLTEDDLARMEKRCYNLSATSSIFFSLLADDRIQIESAGGSSGLNLFARFTDFNPEFRKLAADIAEIEQRFEPDKIIAEVIHEPESRAGNVITHPSFRRYEIPYFSQSGKTAEDTIIPLSDLVISVVNNRLILRSVRFNKEVKPYLSHAYNYLRGAPIFRFFGDFQIEGQTGGFHFDFMKILPDKLFYPRVTYKDIIFSPATWIIKMKHIEEKYGAINIEKLITYLSFKKVARKFVLTEGDNELLICLEQSYLVNIFWEQLKKRKEIIIREFLVDSENYPVINDDGQIMNNQLIALIKHKNSGEAPENTTADLSQNQQNVQRKFSLGSEWVYFKFYCGTYTGDKVLVNKIFPLVKELKRKRLIRQAFFIRYFDTDPHLRIRFKVTKHGQLQNLIEIVREFMLELEQTNTIWKTQTDTYVRELERYPMVIVESESLFSFDSFAILQLLSCPPIMENTYLRLAAGLRLVSDLIDCVKTSIDDKIKFVRDFGRLLKANCGLESTSEKKIKNSYRQKSTLYFSLLQPNQFENIFVKRFFNVNKLLEIIMLKNQNNNLMIDIDDLLGSYIHMCVNRLFMSNQKTYEYIIYDYLFKYYNKLKYKPL